MSSHHHERSQYVKARPSTDIGSVASRWLGRTPAGQIESQTARAYAFRFDHDGLGHLSSVANNAGETLRSFDYNKTSLILYDEAGHWLADYDSIGTITRQAVWMGDYLVGLVDGGKLLYVEPDHLGSPRAVIDPERKITLWRWRPSDDSFGTALPDEDPDADGTRFVFDLRFPGQRYDALTGLHYNYYRDYDPGAGRYIQVDPIGLAGGVNLYLYANAAPLKYTDPTGEMGIVGAVIGAALEVAVQAFGNYRSGCDVLNARNYNWLDVGLAASVGAIAPGWLSVGKKAATSGRAISKLSNQLSRARTVNRSIKIKSRIISHRLKIEEVLIPKVWLQGVKAAGKNASNGAFATECGC